MRYRLLPFVLMFAAVTTACGSPSSTTEPEAQVSNYTSVDAGGDGSDNDDASLPATIAPYVLADVTSTPKMRWSLDNNATITEGYEPKLEVAVSEGTPRRYAIQAFTPILGGKPVVVIQFGRGQELVAPGDYDCASSHAAVLLIDANNVRHITAVTGGAPRACTIHVDVATDLRGPANGGTIRSVKQVTGRFEATVGLQTDPASPTHSVRGAFAALVVE